MIVNYDLRRTKFADTNFEYWKTRKGRYIMKASTKILEYMEGRAYIIGRDGQIRIDDPSLSRGHAEIKFTDGKILLRDLESTNGTYLIIKNRLIKVDQTNVNPNQCVSMGCGKYTIKGLLALAGIYVSYSRKFGLVVKLASPVQKPLLKMAG